jgi:hypothetical protein
MEEYKEEDVPQTQKDRENAAYYKVNSSITVVAPPHSKLPRNG